MKKTIYVCIYAIDFEMGNTCNIEPEKELIGVYPELTKARTAIDNFKRKEKLRDGKITIKENYILEEFDHYASGTKITIHKYDF
jgi:hypothetical protein